MKIYYVYAYQHPQTLEPFYIGKGKGDRCFEHLKCRGSNKHFINTIKKIRSETGTDPLVVKLHEHLSEQEAYDIERQLVHQYGRKLYDNNGVLCNLTLGGHGPLGRVHSDEARLKMSEAKSNMSNETKQKISNSLKGKKLPDEVKNKISQSLTGLKRDDVTNYCKPKSDSHRANIKASHQGADHNRALTWIIKSPDGEIFTITSLKTFCQEHGLKECALYRSLERNQPVAKGASKGWQALARGEKG